MAITLAQCCREQVVDKAAEPIQGLVRTGWWNMSQMLVVCSVITGRMHEQWRNHPCRPVTRDTCRGAPMSHSLRDQVFVGDASIEQA